MNTETNTPALSALSAAITKAVIRDGAEVLAALEYLSDAAGYWYAHDPQEHTRSLQLAERETADAALVSAVEDACNSRSARADSYTTAKMLDAAANLLDG